MPGNFFIPACPWKLCAKFFLTRVRSEWVKIDLRRFVWVSSRKVFTSAFVCACNSKFFEGSSQVFTRNCRTCEGVTCKRSQDVQEKTKPARTALHLFLLSHFRTNVSAGKEFLPPHWLFLPDSVVCFMEDPCNEESPKHFVVKPIGSFMEIINPVEWFTAICEMCVACEQWTGIRKRPVEIISFLVFLGGQISTCLSRLNHPNLWSKVLKINWFTQKSPP